MLLPHGVSVVQSCQVLRFRRRIYSPEEHVIGSEVFLGEGVFILKQDGFYRTIWQKNDKTKHALSFLGPIDYGAKWGLVLAVWAWAEKQRVLGLRPSAGENSVLSILLKCPWARYQTHKGLNRDLSSVFALAVTSEQIKQLRRRKVGNARFNLFECKLTVQLLLLDVMSCIIMQPVYCKE